MDNDGWITFYRVRSPLVGWLLVQKRDGCTRTIRDPENGPCTALYAIGRYCHPSDPADSPEA